MAPPPQNKRPKSQDCHCQTGFELYTPGTPNKNSSNNPSCSGSRSVPNNGGTSGSGGNSLRSCSNSQNFWYPPLGSGPRASSSKGTQDDLVDLESSDGSAYEDSPSLTPSPRPAPLRLSL
jgi:hypothetical protein